MTRDNVEQRYKQIESNAPGLRATAWPKTTRFDEAEVLELGKRRRGRWTQMATTYTAETPRPQPWHRLTQSVQKHEVTPGRILIFDNLPRYTLSIYSWYHGAKIAVLFYCRFQIRLQRSGKIHVWIACGEWRWNSSNRSLGLFALARFYTFARDGDPSKPF